MSRQKNQAYPAGWDEGRTCKLAEHYDNQNLVDQSMELDSRTPEPLDQRLGKADIINGHSRAGAGAKRPTG